MFVYILKINHHIGYVFKTLSTCSYIKYYVRYHFIVVAAAVIEVVVVVAVIVEAVSYTHLDVYKRQGYAYV